MSWSLPPLPSEVPCPETGVDVGWTAVLLTGANERGACSACGRPSENSCWSHSCRGNVCLCSVSEWKRFNLSSLRQSCVLSDRSCVALGRTHGRAHSRPSEPRGHGCGQVLLEAAPCPTWGVRARRSSVESSPLSPRRELEAGRPCVPWGQLVSDRGTGFTRLLAWLAVQVRLERQGVSTGPRAGWGTRWDVVQAPTAGKETAGSRGLHTDAPQAADRSPARPRPRRVSSLRAENVCSVGFSTASSF